MSNNRKEATSYKLLVLVGPTASGKSELAVQLAKKFNGEIISADSRQIYKGMDLGTGKVEGKWTTSTKDSQPLYKYKGITHHLIDFVNPAKQYSAALFKRDAKKTIANILKRGKLPILCGGTAHWIDTVIYNQQIPNVKPNKKLREQMEKESVKKLYLRLKKLDPARASTIDQFNKHRLIRALEIVITTGKPVPTYIQNPPSPYNLLILGINPDKSVLYKKIDARLKQRLGQGMIKEVELLHNGSILQKLKKLSATVPVSKGLPWKKLESFGLEYRYISLYLQKKITYEEMLTQLSYAIKHYSKRQLTWWKKSKEIKWVNNFEQADKLLKN